MILIVAGVSGSGKTTVGALIAGRLRWRFADADTFHPEANVAKMREGMPLTDADREPWLRAITAWMDERIAAGESAVVTCSALKRVYRDRLLSRTAGRDDGLPPGQPGCAPRRLWTRPGHFFPEKLLNSQLAAGAARAGRGASARVVSENGTGQTAARVIADRLARRRAGSLTARLYRSRMTGLNLGE